MHGDVMAKKRGCGCGIAGIAFIVLLVIIVGMFGNANSEAQKALKTERRQDTGKIIEDSLQYLGTVKEIAWYKVIGNDVYIAFKGNVLPDDYKAIANAAAANASRSLTDSGEAVTRCSVWVLPESSAPGGISNVFYNVNARKGKIER